MQHDFACTVGEEWFLCQPEWHARLRKLAKPAENVRVWFRVGQPRERADYAEGRGRGAVVPGAHVDKPFGFNDPLRCVGRRASVVRSGRCEEACARGEPASSHGASSAHTAGETSPSAGAESGAYPDLRAESGLRSSMTAAARPVSTHHAMTRV
jgi:hypothetical protein